MAAPSVAEAFATGVPYETGNGICLRVKSREVLQVLSRALQYDSHLLHIPTVYETVQSLVAKVEALPAISVKEDARKVCVRLTRWLGCLDASTARMSMDSSLHRHLN
jgi:hypothetical protein